MNYVLLTATVSRPITVLGNGKRTYDVGKEIKIESVTYLCLIGSYVLQQFLLNEVKMK